MVGTDEVINVTGGFANSCCHAVTTSDNRVISVAVKGGYFISKCSADRASCAPLGYPNDAI